MAPNERRGLSARSNGTRRATGFAAPRDDDLLARLGVLEQPRQPGLCLVLVDGDHVVYHLGQSSRAA
jgi:hypothetical protein